MANIVCIMSAAYAHCCDGGCCAGPALPLYLGRAVANAHSTCLAPATPHFCYALRASSTKRCNAPSLPLPTAMRGHRLRVCAGPPRTLKLRYYCAFLTVCCLRPGTTCLPATPGCRTAATVTIYGYLTSLVRPLVLRFPRLDTVLVCVLPLPYTFTTVYSYYARQFVPACGLHYAPWLIIPSIFDSPPRDRLCALFATALPYCSHYAFVCTFVLHALHRLRLLPNTPLPHLVALQWC